MLIAIHMSIGRLGPVNSGLSAYARQAPGPVPESVSGRVPESGAESITGQAENRSGILSRRTAQSFSLGPLTIRYEEESTDFNILAQAAQAQVDRIRRFNFTDALQTENERNALKPLDLQSAGRLDGYTAATYGPDARMRVARPAPANTASTIGAADLGAESVSGLASGARAKQALKAYLAALKMSFAPGSEGRLLRAEV